MHHPADSYIHQARADHTLYAHRLATARRILVLGSPGSGKSVFATQLARLTRLPVVALDDLYWEANWQRPEPAVFAGRFFGELSRSAWIMEGNYHHTYLDERLRQADLIIFLDVSTITALWGVVMRSLKRYTGDRSTLPVQVAAGAQYRPRWELGPRFLWLVLSFKLKIRPLMLATFRAADAPVVMLTSRREMRSLLMTLDMTRSKQEA
ncbi:MAG TPA: hypothetical protein VGD58_09435 [Herpetosiphonaceae bacterium]